MFLRQILHEHGLEFRGASLANFALLEVAPRLFIEMALTGNGGILQGVGPGAELAGAGRCQIQHICDL